MQPGINALPREFGGYQAAGGSKASSTCSSDGRTITVQGCYLGDIEVIRVPFFEWNSNDRRLSTEMENVITGWLVLALNGNSPIPGDALINTWEEQRINAFWKTLIGNRTLSNRPIEQEWYRKMFDVARGASPVSTESTGDAKDAFHKFIQPIILEWTHTLFNRRFFTYGYAIMGFCSHACRVGDSIVILAGCRKPVILRKLDGDAWEFHGESYIHGFMDGEADDLIASGKLKLIEFSLQ